MRKVREIVDMGIREKLIDISDLLYKNQTNAGKKKIQEIIPNLAVLAENMTEEQQLRYIENALEPIVEAMNTNDSIYLADLITYELMPFFSEED